jgi:hypothetical protein
MWVVTVNVNLLHEYSMRKKIYYVLRRGGRGGWTLGKRYRAIFWRAGVLLACGEGMLLGLQSFAELVRRWRYFLRNN